MNKLLLNNEIDVLHIIPGYFCNLECTHCGSLSSPRRKRGMSKEEMSLLKKTIKEHLPKNILFTGGEPTFYIDEINELIDSIDKRDAHVIQITTNGWFATSITKTESTISSFLKLDKIQLSFDLFHGSTTTIENIKNIANFCSKNKIDFNISVCISNPTDLNKAADILKEVHVPISYQKAEPFGRAKKNDISFRYFTFQEDVLKTKCPNLGIISYISGVGFTTCCSNLIFNQKNSKYASNSIEGHLSSDFRKNLQNNTMADLMSKYNIKKKELLPTHSSTCSLCEYIHCQS